MASPVGHALVGVAAAGLTAQVTGGPESAALWIGGVIAAGLPDLDLLLRVVGLKGPAYHRKHSHSLFVLAAFVAGGWALVRVTGVPVETELLAAWTAALATHPLLDIVTSGPYTGSRGYGVAILWPLVRHRMHAPGELFDRETGDWSGVRGIRDLWHRVRPEVVLLGPPCAAVVLFVTLF